LQDWSLICSLDLSRTGCERAPPPTVEAAARYRYKQLKCGCTENS
jgi:hypothetical protein